MNAVSTEARRAVVRQYAEAYDHFATMEQELVVEGRYVEAQGAHEHALWCLRAYRNELDDPKPRDWTPCTCD